MGDSVEPSRPKRSCYSDKLTDSGFENELFDELCEVEYLTNGSDPGSDQEEEENQLLLYTDVSMVSLPSAEIPDAESSDGALPSGSRLLRQDDFRCSTAEGELNKHYYTQVEEFYAAVGLYAKKIVPSDGVSEVWNIILKELIGFFVLLHTGTLQASRMEDILSFKYFQ